MQKFMKKKRMKIETRENEKQWQQKNLVISSVGKLTTWKCHRTSFVEVLKDQRRF